MQSQLALASARTALGCGAVDAAAAALHRSRSLASGGAGGDGGGHNGGGVAQQPQQAVGGAQGVGTIGSEGGGGGPQDTYQALAPIITDIEVQLARGKLEAGERGGVWEGAKVGARGVNVAVVLSWFSRLLYLGFRGDGWGSKAEITLPT